ncbi:MAG: asparagine synthase (glutamine-hydrolyzing) [Desulfobacteraceae bacterium]|nr:asparagine synthase (glutamine-hydrolyzing) [Desulfobacteraceae bacterium]MBC2749211.1 asparagine synthase (glutamine-hydrolyzing) [Desulfobacteraceae bacterium]
MCGICGIYHYNHSGRTKLAVDHDVIQRMSNAIHRRGPDDCGCHVQEDVGIGNRRLSIIDLSKGHQPIYNENHSAVIVYNGEIYNFQEIRKELIVKGHLFRTDTDTEMILHAYEEYGEKCVALFNGMFAFAIWDNSRRKLFMARDRLGIKPLFYSDKNGAIVFGSEIKCILESRFVQRKLNTQAMDQFFALGYVPCPDTIFTDIRKLPPGHTMSCDRNGIHIQRYWDIDFEKIRCGTIESLTDEFVELLKQSVKLRLIADVPLGAFLSGGIDSSLIVRLMHEVSEIPPRTFSIGFEDAVYDESQYAEIAAKNANAQHHNFYVKPDIGGIFDHIIEAFDEPFADDGAIPCYHVCRETRKEVKVALSGLGGDELFGGYHRYLGFQLSHLSSKIPFVRLGIWKRLIAMVPESRQGGYTVDRVKRFVEAMHLPPEQRYIHYLYNLDLIGRKTLFHNDISQAIDHQQTEKELIRLYRQPRTAHEINKAYYLDFMTYLPEDVLALTDRMSMWHSLEVRVPFLDHHLVEFAASLDPKLKIKGTAMKYFLKRAASQFLPQQLINKRKQGFVGPLPVWLNNELKEFTLDTLSSSNLKRHGIFNHTAVKKILDEHMGLQRKHETLIWSMLVFDHWHRKYLE